MDTTMSHLGELILSIVGVDEFHLEANNMDSPYHLTIVTRGIHWVALITEQLENALQNVAIEKITFEFSQN